MWQKISAIVGVISLIWVLFQYNQEKIKNQAAATTILNQAKEIYNLQEKINIHNQQKKLLQLSHDSLLVKSKESRSLAIFWRSEAMKLNSEINNLKLKLNEKPDNVFSSDSAEIIRFLGWTK